MLEHKVVRAEGRRKRIMKSQFPAHTLNQLNVTVTTKRAHEKTQCGNDLTVRLAKWTFSNTLAFGAATRANGCRDVVKRYFGRTVITAGHPGKLLVARSGDKLRWEASLPEI